MKRFVMLTLSTICVLAFVAPSVATPLQTPPEEQNPWLCYDDVGWERPCTATEEYRRCLDTSMVAYWTMPEEVGAFGGCCLLVGVYLGPIPLCTGHFAGDRRSELSADH